MSQIQINYENKIHLFFLGVGLVISAYGCYAVISVMTAFPKDVNMFAVTMSLVLLGIITAGCAFGIIHIIINHITKNMNGENNV